MKQRVDTLLVELGEFPSREKAARAVMAGQVWLDSERITKPSRQIKHEERHLLRVQSRDHALSRAYYKLQAALEHFPVSVGERICLDIGSSTGGFTQCLLEQGAALVFAVDCGTNQLHYSLRRDPRVCVMERTNARYLDLSLLEPVPDLAVMDVSFISVTKILPVLGRAQVIRDLVLLIKPQFEAGRTQVGKGGIVRDPQVHAQVLNNVCTAAIDQGLYPAGLIASPLHGSEGNREFLAWLRPEPGLSPEALRQRITGIVLSP